MISASLGGRLLLILSLVVPGVGAILAAGVWMASSSGILETGVAWLILIPALVLAVALTWMLTVLGTTAGVAIQESGLLIFERHVGTGMPGSSLIDWSSLGEPFLDGGLVKFATGTNRRVLGPTPAQARAVLTSRLYPCRESIPERIRERLRL